MPNPLCGLKTTAVAVVPQKPLILLRFGNLRHEPRGACVIFVYATGRFDR